MSNGNVAFEKGARGGMLHTAVLTAPPRLSDMNLAHALVLFFCSVHCRFFSSAGSFLGLVIKIFRPRSLDIVP